MKKQITISLLVTASFLFITNVSKAQWTLTGTNIYPTTVTNWVGIGTTGPSNAVDIISPYIYTIPWKSGLRLNKLKNPTSPNGSVLTVDSTGDVILVKADGNDWHIKGNTGTTASTAAIGSQVNNNFIGTNDATDWVMATDSLERMRITSGGNVGIGTTTPVSKLNVAGTTGLTWTISANNSGLTTIGDGGTGGSLYVNTPSFGSTVQSGLGVDGTYGTPSFKSVINLKALGVQSNGNVYGSELAFWTTSQTILAEKMRILSNGNVGIGTTAPAAKLHIDGGNVYLLNNSGSPRLIIGDLTSSSAAYGSLSWNSTSGYLYLGVGNSPHLSILNTGNVGIGTTAPTALLSVNGAANKPGAGDWTNFSDIRVKKDTSAFTDGLSVIKKIHPVYYRYNGKAGIKDTNTLNIGVIAQQIQPIAPYTVGTYMAKLDSTDTQETELLDYNQSSLTYLFVNAFKELDSINVQKDSVINNLNQKLINSDSINTALDNAQQQSMDSLRTITTTQSTIITSLQNQLTQLASLIDGCCNSNGNGQGNGNNNNLMQSDTNNYKSLSSTTLTDVELSNKNTVVLFQNVPNPFAEQTTISYYLPDNVQRAQILFFEQSGKIIKTVDLTEKGKGVLNVFANDLSNGMYTYSLIIDGQTIETKKMIKQ